MTTTRTRGFRQTAAPETTVAPTNGATEKQIAFIKTLGTEAREVAGDNELRTELLDILAIGMKSKMDEGTFGKQDASRMIEALMETKKNWQNEDRAAGQTSRRSDRPEPEAGMYKLEDGTIVRVYLGQKSGRMLAKKLVSEGDEHEYAYMGAASRFVSPDTQKLSLEEAKEFGRMTGTCCVCARRLDDPESVEAGIGPVCASKF